MEKDDEDYRIDPNLDSELDQAQDRIFSSIRQLSEHYSVHLVESLNVKLVFNNNQIICLDPTNDIKIISKKLDSQIKSVEKESDTRYKITTTQDLTKVVTLSVFGKYNSTCTDSEYILDLVYPMADSNRGFYFGLYGIGEFKLNGKEINIVKSMKIKYVSNGLIRSENEIYLSLRTGEKEQFQYFLGKLDWKQSTEAVNVEKISVPSKIIGLYLFNDLIHVAYRSGEVEIRNPGTLDILETIRVFENEISSIFKVFDELCVGGKGGEFAIMYGGKISTVIKLSKVNIVGIDYFDDHYHILDRQANLYIVNRINKEVIDTLSLNHSVSSNLIQLKKWYIFTIGAGIISYAIGNPDLYHRKYIEDPLIRVLRPNKWDFITGDDDGCLRRWDLINLKIHSEDT